MKRENGDSQPISANRGAQIKRRSSKSEAVPVVVSVAILIAVLIGAPLMGSSHIELGRAFAGVSPDHEIFFYARLPRVILAMLGGAALSVTGVLFQCMLRDPLAEPYTLGVSSGASVGAVIAICLGWRATGVASLAGAA